MKDLTVKFKNIEYSYKHGLDCLAKVATTELIKNLPKNKNIFIDSENVITICDNNDIFILTKTSSRNWNDLDSLKKLNIYNKLFLKF